MDPGLGCGRGRRERGGRAVVFGEYWGCGGCGGGGEEAAGDAGQHCWLVVGSMDRPEMDGGVWSAYI